MNIVEALIFIDKQSAIKLNSYKVMWKSLNKLCLLFLYELLFMSNLG